MYMVLYDMIEPKFPAGETSIGKKWQGGGNAPKLVPEVRGGYVRVGDGNHRQSMISINDETSR